MYKYKYHKYKNKYNKLILANDNIAPINTKSVESTEPEFRNIDLDLFFDLLQVSRDIINLTLETNIIILIGDTPSYLAPFLQKERSVHHFAFSGKPFGCFSPPYSLPNEIGRYTTDVYTPTIDALNNYFDYLDNKTELTRSFVKKNWKNIVLVDSSSGASISGCSVFFNRYVGNIKQENNDILCTDIEGSVPMKFIGLSSYGYLNLDPGLLEKIYADPKNNRNIGNYRPDLIIYLGPSFFYHREYFMLEDAYPRIMPHYNVTMWDIPPNLIKNDGLQKALDNIQKLKSLLEIYLECKANAQNQSKSINAVKRILPELELDIDDLNKYFDGINLQMLSKKYYYYFNKDPNSNI